MKYVLAILGGLFYTIVPVLLLDNREFSILFIFIYLMYRNIMFFLGSNKVELYRFLLIYIKEAHPKIIEKDEFFSGNSFEEAMKTQSKGLETRAYVALTEVATVLAVLFFVVNSV